MLSGVSYWSESVKLSYVRHTKTSHKPHPHLMDLEGRSGGRYDHVFDGVDVAKHPRVFLKVRAGIANKHAIQSM